MHVHNQTIESTHDVYVENPNREKPQEPTDSELSLYEKGTIRDSEATTSSSVSSLGGGYNRVSLCVSLSLSLTLTLYTIVTTSITHISKSYLYSCDLRSIYKRGLNGLTQTFLQICPLFWFSLGPLIYIRPLSESHPKGPNTQHSPLFVP